eukprot:1322259-Pyramimonas_sp.AAC.1
MKLLKKSIRRRPIVFLNRATMRPVRAEGLAHKMSMTLEMPSMTSRAPPESYEKCSGRCPSTAAALT